jgi:hypothetical protein
MGLQVRMARADCRLQPRDPGSQRSSQAACGDFRSDRGYRCEIITDRAFFTNFSRCEKAVLAAICSDGREPFVTFENPDHWRFTFLKLSSHQKWMLKRTKLGNGQFRKRVKREWME